MANEIRYYSTNHKAPDVGFKEALLTGQAPDKGLYNPSRFPPLDEKEILDMANKSYAEIATTVLCKYTDAIIPIEVQEELCKEAYNYPVPLEKARDRIFVMRLDSGPTFSFKDFAARMMARWMSYFIGKEGGELTILTATSGDTGSAIANAFYNLERINVVVLFPYNEVSNRQRKQMTTLAGNVTMIAFDTKFDDGQTLVKTAFADPELKHIRLTSANSINIGRLLPQAVYYFYAYAKLAKGFEPLTISVPSGNFGDMMGAVIARQMGLPLKKLVVATNANYEFPEFIKTGEYKKIVPSLKCISNAMNVGHPSNLARLIDLYGGEMDEQGNLKKSPNMERLRNEIYAISISDDETRETIKRAWERDKLLLEPHGAVGWAGLSHYIEESGEEGLCISVETAHPAKFPEEIVALLGFEPDAPPALKKLDNMDERYISIKADYNEFKKLLIKRFS
ncbi:MAG: threonine synthase [Myxococcota bacterium]